MHPHSLPRFQAHIHIFRLPEVPFDVEKFLAKVKDLLNKKASIVIAVSEGIKLADGRYVCELGSVGDYVDAIWEALLCNVESSTALVLHPHSAARKFAR